ALDARLVRRRHRRLYGVTETQLRARGSRSGGLVLPAPEEEARRDVHPFERIVDTLEMPREEIAGAGAELIDEEGAAGAQHAVRRSGNRGTHARGQGREGQAREDIISLFEAMRADDFLDVG